MRRSRSTCPDIFYLELDDTINIYALITEYPDCNITVRCNGGNGKTVAKYNANGDDHICIPKDKVVKEDDSDLPDKEPLPPQDDIPPTGGLTGPETDPETSSVPEVTRDVSAPDVIPSKGDDQVVGKSRFKRPRR